ncbi:clotting factor B-like [Ornithodoros turicata]|uniref:clotting factor B-like n=1 Tax=Ornithodoros turicata TaxID=34597 RepID=UPI003139FF02
MENVVVVCLVLILAAGVRSKECGVKRLKSDPGAERPWLGSIVQYGSGKNPDFLCMGTLISNQHILTAAHCFDGKPLSPRRYSVQLESESSDSGTEYNIHFITRHPSYVRGQTYNDLAILTLRTEVPDVTVPVCLPDPAESLDNMRAYVGEWLPKTPGGKDPYALSSQLALISTNEECNKYYGEIQLSELSRGLQGSQVCTDSRRGHGDCNRLTASPLMVTDRKQRWHVVAVASYRHNCDVDDTHPGIYTRVGDHLSWIQGVMRS